MQTTKDNLGTSDLQKQLERIHNIAEILSKLEEVRLGKDWLIQEIKKHRVKISYKATMNSLEIMKLCPDEFISKVLRALRGEDIEEFEEVTTLTRTYHWFFTDIVAGSNPKISAKDQVRKIIVLNELISRTNIFKNKDPATVILPTGDGMAIGFHDSVEKPLLLAIELHKFLNKYNEMRKGKEELLIRVGIDMGPVYVIKDLNQKENVWGPGIILTRRVMDLAGDMNIVASARIADELRRLSPEYKTILHPIGDYAIKHGEELLLYNCYGDDFGNKTQPKKHWIPKPTEEDIIKPSFNFSFNSINIVLEVRDAKTMLTHHSWVWDLTNISKEPKDQVFYRIGGDVPREFKDLNVNASDDRGNKLDILSVSSDKPLQKEFMVKLKNPIQPKQKKKIKLEYDWEEPDRVFGYGFSSDCKEFSYLMTIPKGIELKNRVLRTDPETGYRIHTTPTPQIKFLDDMTVMSWAKSNLKAHDAYEFYW